MGVRIAYAWVLVAAGCAACAGPALKDENSPYYRAPAGTKIILHRDLSVPPGWARVYLQRGEVVKAAGILEPFCRFEVRDVLPVPQTIKADEFTVSKTQMDQLNVTSHGAVAVAAIGESGGAVSDVSRVWILWLDSPRQPHVQRLVCGGRFEEPYRAQRPSINEIRAQLGAVATLVLPAGPPEMEVPDN